MQEEEQLAQLGRMRSIATGLLVLMAVVFVVARLLEPRYSYLTFVTAFAEAAMVGALADWFAVTALFRRPFGLPIPHTAIIPSNKDRIGESVANFLEHNFMTREVLHEELSQVDFAGAAAAWLAEPANSLAISRQVVDGIPTVFRIIEDEDVSAFMQKTMTGALRNVKVAPFMAEVLTILVADRRHQVLFDHLIAMASRALEENRPYIRLKIHEKSPSWIPRFVDERLYEKLLEETQNILDEMRAEGSDWRDRFQAATQELIDKLRTSPEYEEKISGMIAQTLAHPKFRDYAGQIWRDVKDRLITDSNSPESRSVAQLDRMLHVFSVTLMQNPVVQQKLDGWIRDFLTAAVSERRHAIADLVKRVIWKWDADTVSRKFELYVGKDLQYIRINGTLVGGMVGLVLHAVSLAL